jgi:Mg-chelatase subunit ChlD
MKAFYSGFEFRAAVEEILGKVNVALDLRPIRVEWTKRIQTAAINTDGHVLLADVSDDTRVDHATLVRYCGMGAHELCHHAYTDWFAVSRASNGTPLLRQLHNAVEDAYIERRAIRAGLTGNIEALFTSLIGGMVSEALREVDDWSDPAQYPFALAVYLRDHAAVKVPLAPGLDVIFAGAADRFKSCDSSEDALKIAQWVEDQLMALPKNPQPQPKPQPKPQPGDEQPGQPDQPGKGEGEGEGEGEGQPGGEEEGQEDPQKAAGDAEKGDGTPTPQPDPARAPTGYEDYRTVEPAVESPDVDGKGGRYGSYCEASHLSRKGYHVGYGRNKVDVTVPGALRYNLKRLFDNSARVEFGLRRKAGSVDVNSLSRIGTSDKLFKRRSEVDGIDSAVVILLDVSGSMADDALIGPAVECCAALLDTLDRAQVKTCILSFGSTTSVVKDWTDRKALGTEALSTITASGGTNDFFAVRYAHKLLTQRPEERKVVIVLTDGCGQVNATAEQVRAGEAMGITTVGIGIRVDVSRVYSQNVRVNNVSDLGAASFKQIKLAM